MIGRLFPARADNDFQGHRAALWAFAALTAVSLWRSLHHVFAPDGGAQSIASITLDSFPPGAAATVVTVFALWGISQLVLALAYGVVLWRYRSLVPLMYALMSVEYAMRAALPLFKDGVEKSGTAPGEVANLVLLIALPILFALSIQNSKPLHKAQRP
jgi:hypothetical protein